MIEPPSGLRGIWHELRRRRVIRVVVLYAFVGWVLIQVAATTFPILLLPDWTVRLVVALTVLGLPVAAVLAWAYDVTPEGVRRASATDADLGRGSEDEPGSPAAASAGASTGPGARPRGAGWRDAALLAGTVLVLGAGTLVLRSPAGTPGAPDAPDAPATPVLLTSVAVLPFSVGGNPELEYLGEGMVDLLSAKLDGTAGLRAVDPRALLSYVSREAPGRLDPERARGLAQRFGAGLFIMGGVLQLGNRVQLTAALYGDSAREGPLASATVEGDLEEIWELVDVAAARLLAERLGGEGRLAQLAARTTTSFDALRSYLEGERALRQARFQVATEAFAAAVAADSSFALAHYRLAISSGWSWQEAIALPASEQAVRYAYRLSERDRQLVSAYRAYMTGSAAEAERLYRAVLASHPDDAEASYQLGEAVFHYSAQRGHSVHDARPAFVRARELAPDFDLPIMHLIDLAVARKDTAELRGFTTGEIGSPETTAYARIWLAYLGEQRDMTPLLDFVRPLPGSVLVGLATGCSWIGDTEVGVTIADLLLDPARGEGARAAAHLIRAELRARHGRWREAAAELSAAEQLAPGEALIRQALLSLHPLAPSTDEDRRGVLRRLEAWTAQPGGAEGSNVFAAHADLYPVIRGYLIGRLAAALGNAGRTRRQADEIQGASSPDDAGTLLSDLAHALRGAAAIAASAPAPEALAHFALMRRQIPALGTCVSTLIGQDEDRYQLAALLAAAESDDEAIGWLTALAETSASHMAPAHLRLAELHERRGDRALARHHYARFVELWEGADEEVQPLVRDANQRLAALLPDAR